MYQFALMSKERRLADKQKLNACCEGLKWISLRNGKSANIMDKVVADLLRNDSKVIMK